MAAPHPSATADSGRLRRSLLATLALVGAIAAAMLMREQPFSLGGDAEMLQHPLLVDAFRHVKAGRLPVWTIGRWGGSPLLGDPVAGALYPPYYLGYALTPFPHWHALDVSTCLHLALLALGTVCLMDRLGAGGAPAVATAIFLATSPVFVWSARGWQQHWAAPAYWPWLFWAAAALARAPRVGAALVATICLAAPVYAGYPEFAVYSGIPALLWVVIGAGRDAPRRVGLVLLIGVGAIALALPQMLPGLDMSRESIRFGPGAAERMQLADRIFAFNLQRWVDTFGPTPTPLLFGKIAPAVAVAAIVGAAGRGFAAGFFMVTAVVSAVLATGPNALYRFLHLFPPFSLFIGPAKLFFVTNFAVVALAGLGLARATELPTGRLRLLVVAVGIAFVLSFHPRAVEAGACLVAVALLAALPRRALPSAAMVLTVASAVVFLPATQTLNLARPVISHRFMPLLRHPLDLPANGGARALALDEGRTLFQVGLNFGALWEVGSWNGMGDLLQWRQYEVLENAAPRAAVDLARALGADPTIVGEGSPLASRLVGAGFRQTGQLGGLSFLSPPAPVPPRAELAPRAKGTTAERAIAAARRGRVLDHRRVLVEAEPLPGGAVGDPGGRLDLLEESPGSLRARVAVARPTWFVMREPYYRNWQATVDGRAVPVYPVGGFLLGLLVDTGTHEVRVVYREPHLFPGVIVAALTALLLPVALRRVVPR